MSAELYRRARRAEARAERAEDRRRLRLEFFRSALAEGLDSLKLMHAGGASGQESVKAHARLIDDVVRRPHPARSWPTPRPGRRPAPVVVVALGGYGRGELHPSSDIDLMVVHDGELAPYVQRVTQELLYTLWDLGLQIGHSLRSLEDCVAMARTDLPSRTSMQEARFLAGDRRSSRRFQRVLEENVYRQDFEQFLEAMLAERDQRYRKHGASPYVMEPNVKESAGGLRDMHTAMWLSAAKFGARTLRELTEKALITEREQELTDAALTFLWRVRNELHFLSGHRNDVLTRDLQPQVAKSFGYAGRRAPPGRRALHARLLPARPGHPPRGAPAHRALPGDPGAARPRRAPRAPAGPGRRARLHRRPALSGRPRRPRRFAADPTRLLKAFWHAHRLGCELSLELERALEAALDRIDDGVRRSPTARDLFLDICRSWGRVAVTLSQMHELGLLGRYLPEFGALTCLVQYDVYHRFSADRHSLLAVEHLEALAPGKSAESEGAAQVFARSSGPSC